MFTALLLDEEPTARRRLRAQLQRYCPEISVIVEADSVDAAKEACMGGRFDLGFVNTHLGGRPAGLAFGRLARHCIQHLIFITADTTMALEAFRARAFDFLVQPLDRPELQRVVREIRPRAGAGKNARITLSDRGKFIVLEEADILRVEGSGSYVTVHSLHQPPITICQYLSKFTRRLSSERFVRVHQSHLINLDYLREVTTADGYIAVLKDGNQVPVSKRLRKKLMAKL